MDLNELQAHIKSGPTVNPPGLYAIRRPATRITCADGFNLSVQASATHYCTPRDNEGPYTHVEIGFPSDVEPELMPYVEDAERPTDTVYAQVPIEVALAVINKHGGRG